MKKTISVGFLVAVMAVAELAMPFTSQAVVANYVLNSSLEVGTSSPDHFTPGGYGTNNRVLTYEVLPDLTKAVKVAITQYTDGDAKWVFENVAVHEGDLYRFSDRYQSTATTYLSAAFTLANNATYYEQIATLPASPGVWQTGSQEFTVPAGVTSVTIFHLLRSVGELITDDYSLTTVADAAANQFSQGIVTISFDDGWANQYDNASPLLSALNLPATYFIITKPMEIASYDFFTAQSSTIVTNTTANSVSWSQIFPDPTNSKYRFTDTYTSTDPSTLVVNYTAVDGTPAVYPIGSLPAGANAAAAFNFTLPPILPATPIAIVHSVSNISGTLTVSNHVLNEYNSGYMTKGQVLDLQLHGNEIGAHTVNHCNLAALPNLALCAYQPVGGVTTPSAEISGSKTALNFIGGTPIDVFAYPNGGYTQAIKDLLNPAGLFAGRSIDAGFNTRFSDRLSLKSQIVDIQIPVAIVKGWIDSAAANKTWLILTFHQVADPVTLSSNGEDGGVSTAYFQDVINYIATKKNATTNPILVKNIHDVLPLMISSVAPNNAPMIALSGNATINLTVGGTFIDDGAAATDTEDGNLTSQIVISGTVNTAIAGTYVRTYSVTDSGNLTAHTTRTIVVSPAPIINQAPVVTLLGNSSMTLSVNGTFTDPGASAVDVEDGDLTASIVKTGTVDANTIGTYTLTYTVSDTQNLAGNTVNRTVEVTAVAPASGGSGGGSGGGSSGGSSSGGGSTTLPVPAPAPITLPSPGQVLGATCTPLISQNLVYGKKNPVNEVKKLQIFLNGNLGLNIPITGFYGTATRNAVKAFQLKYKSEILTPLGLTQPTGNVHNTTRAKINSLSCVAN
ncbi:MAG: PII-type proteinase [Candidatus Parcubacteria bacterium]